MKTRGAVMTSWLVAGALLAACSLMKKKDDGPLPAVCEDYLAQYTCYMNRTTGSTTGADVLRQGWEMAAAKSAAARNAVEISCKQQLDRQLPEFKANGCGTPKKK